MFRLFRRKPIIVTETETADDGPTKAACALALRVSGFGFEVVPLGDAVLLTRLDVERLLAIIVIAQEARDQLHMMTRRFAEAHIEEVLTRHDAMAGLAFMLRDQRRHAEKMVSQLVGVLDVWRGAP
jgi:hypothetical protein